MPSLLDTKSHKLSCKTVNVTLCRWYDAIVEASDDIATIMTAECGKPLAEAKGEVIQG